VRRRPATRPPAAATVAAWIVLLAGLLVSAAGLAPAWADPAPSPANASTITTTEPASSSSTTTSEPVGSTTTSPKPTNASSTTVTTQLASSTTTTTTPAAMLTASSPAPGTLSINAPGLAYLGADARNARTLSAHLGTVRVTDTRRVVDGAWTASVSATTFSNGHQSPNQQLPRSSIAYWSGPVLHRTGTATLVPGQAGPAQAVLLTRTRTAFSATAVTGDNTATWNPTIIIRIPPAAVAGHYHGTILHSVA
jgi:hypothetical protein